MSNSIWIHYSRPRPHWYLLSEPEQTALQQNWSAIREQAEAAGGATQGRFHIRGQHDFQEVEIWTFPQTMDAFNHWSNLVAARYNEFFAFSNNIGLGLEA
ncbi:hypothetical protein GCM10007913_25810 [Devosia yakushimensis]|uniref:DUF4268 domain-containing protein n=1 Tax=Devosia yakushimensis TaxID=470028 RepID=A0ABQ5UG99_9HYPH|nr:hypothetical protein [Devosia yakushimensis]GLQ10649.1 hypothetical protein GCM10007913_25810 [Devosia yakushimensis]